MKKILGLIVIFTFILSILGSASPQINSKVKTLTGNKIYASTSLPLPLPIGLEKNLAEKAK